MGFLEKMIKVLELFSGYGGASFALKKAGIPHQTIGYSDIEKYANDIFTLNHGKDIPQLGDIKKINPEELEDFDLLTGGFPCQSFSIAGKREGFEAVDKGQLFFDIIRIAKVKNPKYMLLENVQGLLSHDNGDTFKIVLHELKKIGYYVNWKLMFSKEHGTPQNRPRVWIACFREKEDYDRFVFPEKEELVLTVKDLLEDNIPKEWQDKIDFLTNKENISQDEKDELESLLKEKECRRVDEKYYLNKNQLKKIQDYNKNNKDRGRGFKIEPQGDVCNTITSHTGKDNNSVPIFNSAHTKANGSRFKDDGTSFTLEATKSQSLCIADFRYDEGIRPRKDGISPTLTSGQKSGEGLSGSPIINTITTGYGRQGSSAEFIAINKQLNQHTNRWRRLTPRECFRLMGFFNDEIQFGDLSDSKLYFLAGNGWDVNVAAKIFTQMFIGNKYSQQQNVEQWF